MAIDKELRHRVGCIYISDEFLSPDGIRKIADIFQDFFPIAVEYEIWAERFKVTGYSPLFKIVPPGERVPVVSVSIQENRDNLTGVVSARKAVWSID